MMNAQAVKGQVAAVAAAPAPAPVQTRKAPTSIEASKAFTAIQKLQEALIHIEASTKCARECVRSQDQLTAGRALVALALCQQAKDQVRVACQNMGFSMTSLLSIDENGTSVEAEEQRRQLKAAKQAIVKLIVQKMGVPQIAVCISINAFAEESAIVALMIVNRADRHLNATRNRA